METPQPPPDLGWGHIGYPSLPGLTPMLLPLNFVSFLFLEGYPPMAFFLNMTAFDGTSNCPRLRICFLSTIIGDQGLIPSLSKFNAAVYDFFVLRLLLHMPTCFH